MKHFVFLFLGVATLMACNGNKGGADEAKIEEARKEVMDLHDEAMPLIADMGQLAQRLEMKLDTMTVDDSMARAKVADAKEQLNQAEEAMFDWMAEYNKVTLSELEADSALSFLAQQKERMKQVADQMHSSIANAEVIVGKVQKGKSDHDHNGHDHNHNHDHEGHDH